VQNLSGSGYDFSLALTKMGILPGDGEKHAFGKSFWWSIRKTERDMV
jgi:hypothetical protein